MESSDSSLSHIPIRRLCQTNLNQSQSPSLPVAVPTTENNNNNVVNAVTDAPPKYSPPPSYSVAVGLRVAKALRNSIRRSVRRFRRSDNNSQTPNEATNIPSISSNIDSRPQSMSTAGQRLSLNEFIRSSFRRNTRNSQSNEHLVLNDITTDYHVV